MFSDGLLLIIVIKTLYTSLFRIFNNTKGVVK